MATTLFPDIDVVAVAGWLTVALIILSSAAVVVLHWISSRHSKTAAEQILDRQLAEANRRTWRMPPLTLLEPVRWSAGTKLGMLALRAYLVVGALLLVVKAIQVSRG
jgi:hypothetical protein